TDVCTMLENCLLFTLFFFSSRRRHTRSKRDWSSDVCSSDLCYPVKKVDMVMVHYLVTRKRPRIVDAIDNDVVKRRGMNETFYFCQSITEGGYLFSTSVSCLFTSRESIDSQTVVCSELIF